MRNLKRGRCARCVLFHLPLLLGKYQFSSLLTSKPITISILCLLRIPLFFSFLARELTKVAILAKAECVVGSLMMSTIVCSLCSSLAVVACLTVAFCVELLVCVRTHVDFFGPFLFFLNLYAHLFDFRIQWPSASLLTLTLNIFFLTFLAAIAAYNCRCIYVAFFSLFNLIIRINLKLRILKVFFLW